MADHSRQLQAHGQIMCERRHLIAAGTRQSPGEIGDGATSAVAV
jgi:hypothetical protein